MARIYIRISEEEKNVIFEKSRCAGFNSCSTYMRFVALNRRIVAVADIKTVIELRRIGNNLNQITKKINTNSSESEILKLNTDLNIAIEKINTASDEIIQKSTKLSKKMLY